VHQATRLFVEVAQRSNRTVPSYASAKLAALARQRVRTKDASGIAGRKCLRLEALICPLAWAHRMQRLAKQVRRELVSSNDGSTSEIPRQRIKSPCQ
jgi:hypothetical protein